MDLVSHHSSVPDSALPLNHRWLSSTTSRDPSQIILDRIVTFELGMLLYPFRIVLYALLVLFLFFFFFLVSTAYFRSAWRIWSMHADHCLGRRIIYCGGTNGRQRRGYHECRSVFIHLLTCYKGWMQMPHFLYSWMHGIIIMEFVSETDLNLCTGSWWKLSVPSVSLGFFSEDRLATNKPRARVCSVGNPASPGW